MTLALLTLLVPALQAQTNLTFPLWPEGAPGALGKEDKDIPTLTPYLSDPARATGAAIVICPGGGYGGLANHEGEHYARWLNEQGIAGLVLKYRLGPAGYHHPAMLQDAQRALRTVRARAFESGISPRRIGIWGFSAGGHLASSASTHFDAGNARSDDPVERMSSRPDFLILAYPVISFLEYVHEGSKNNLLGDNPDPKLVTYMSSEQQVTPETPPTFLFHTNEDKGVPPENSVLFYLALRKAGVPAELHIYEKGQHGAGLAWSDLTLSTWPARLADWLRAR